MNKETIELAIAWLDLHKEHVKKIISNSNIAVKPVGEDLNNPALWKAIHWNWFIIEYKIVIRENKKWWQFLK